MSDTSPQGEEREARTAAEWMTFAVSLLLLSAVVALIATQIPGENAPPAPAVEQAGAIRETGGRFHVPVEVENRGDTTAQNVQVLATLTLDDGKEIVADQVIDFLAGGEVEDLEFVFDEDPADGELTLAVAGYGVP